MSSVHAYTEFDANGYYEAANTYYKDHLYKNALRDVHLARGIYSDLGKAWGLPRCDALIAAIEIDITPGLAAAYYYDIASDFYLQGLDTTEDYYAVELYEYTKVFGRLAIGKYEGLGDEYGSKKSNDIVFRAGKEITTRMTYQRLLADGYYEKAYNSYVSEKYADTLSNAEQAYTLYQKIGNENDIIRGERLLSDIHSKIDGIKRNADTTYLNAKKKHSDGEFRIALEYAETTLNLYKLISDREGISKANILISDLRRILEMETEEMLRQADRYKKIAKEELVHMNYENASDYIKRASEIYREFYDKAYKERRERDRKYWQGILSESDRLHRQILDEWGEDQAKSSGNRYYDRAQAFFIAKQYKEALNYARKSEIIYLDIQFWVGVERAEALIRTINERVGQENMADGNLTMALNLCTGADFANAKNYLRMSKQIYDILLGLNRTAEINEVAVCITEGEKKKEQAKEYFNKAYDYYQMGDYRGAKNDAEKAMDIYVDINYSLGLNETQGLYSKADKEVKEMNRRLRNTILSIGAVILVVAIVIVKYMKKKSTLEDDASKMKEERDKVEDLERKKWEVKKEEVTEEKVKEELKKIIEEERKTIGE